MSTTRNKAGTSEVSVSGGLYERKATGLVRSISLSSGIYFNIITVGVMWSVLALTQIAGGFPGANPVVSAILGLVLSLFPVLLYGIWTAMIPRSGGDYVWIGRTFHPWLGLAANVNATVWYVLGNGLLAYLIAQSALPTFFGTLGRVFSSSTLTHWATDVTAKGWTFGIGAAALMAAGALAQFVSMRKAMRAVFVFFLITMIGLIVAIFVLAFTSHADFVRTVQQSGGHYAAVYPAAAKAGYQVGHFSLWQSMLAIPPLYLALAYTVAAAYTGGEIRRPQVTGILSPLIAAVTVGVLVIIAFALAQSVMGAHWIGAATALSTAGSKAYPFAQPAGFFSFVSVMTHSNVLLVIIAVAFVAAPLSTILATVLFATRNFFAWSFDRMLPSSVANVSDRTGTPTVAPAIVTLISLIYLAFLTWGSATFSTALGAIITGTTLSFMVTAVAGIVFPWQRREMFRLSPTARWSIAGIPTISVIAAIALAVYGFMFYSLLSQDALGSNSTASIVAMVIVLVIAGTLYPLAYVANKRQGIDVSLAGRELPPE